MSFASASSSIQQMKNARFLELVAVLYGIICRVLSNVSTTEKKECQWVNYPFLTLEPKQSVRQ